MTAAERKRQKELGLRVGTLDTEVSLRRPKSSSTETGDSLKPWLEPTHRPPYRHHLIAEAESFMLEDLFKECQLFKAEYYVDDFHAANESSFFNFFDHLQRELSKKRTAAFSVYPTDLAPFHLQLIISSLNPNNKNLFLKEDSRLLSDLDQIEAYDINLAEHPSVAALATTLSYLKENESVSGLSELDYSPTDPFDYL